MTEPLQNSTLESGSRMNTQMFNHPSSNHIHNERHRQNMECFFFSQLLLLVKTQLPKGLLLPVLIAQSDFLLFSDSNPSLGKKGQWQVFSTWKRKLHLRVPKSLRVWSSLINTQVQLSWPTEHLI